MTRRLDPLVERLLNQFPDGVAVRANGHTAFDFGVVRELGAPDDIQIPLGEVLRTRSDLGYERFGCGFLGHSVVALSETNGQRKHIKSDELSWALSRSSSQENAYPPCGTSSFDRRAPENLLGNGRRDFPHDAAPRWR